MLWKRTLSTLDDPGSHSTCKLIVAKIVDIYFEPIADKPAWQCNFAQIRCHADPAKDFVPGLLFRRLELLSVGKPYSFQSQVP